MNVPYELSQKSRLVDEVRILASELGRPVSSKDLTSRWSTLPDRRPILLQSVGQLLLKASRMVRGQNPRLRQVGTIRKLTFYATDDAPAWVESFRKHEIALRAAQHIKWSIPEYAGYLLGTEHDALARNALSGFIAEWEPVAADKSIVLPSRIHDLLEIAKKEAPCSFTGRCPNLIGRNEAANILRAEMRTRNPLFCEVANINRHLSRLAWPMCPFFAESGFWEFQLRQYCSAKWPNAYDDDIMAKAASLCAIYGTSPLVP